MTDALPIDDLLHSDALLKFGGAWREALHPRGLDGRFIDVSLSGRAGDGSGIAYSGTVHAHVPKGEPYAGTYVADVQKHSYDGSQTTVSLHLPDDHPVVKDALTDGLVSSPDQVEAIVTLPSERVKANNDSVPLKSYAERAASAVKVRRAVQRRAEEKRRNIAEHRTSGRNLFPELDASRRDRGI